MSPTPGGPAMPFPINTVPLNFSSMSFLVVDDQPFSRRLVRSILLGFGSREVYESANGIEALEVARTAMPSIVITDLIMPIFDGLRFVKMLKEPQGSTHRTPIIVLSGYLTKAAALTVKNSGADELLVKPVSPKSLYEHIARVMLRGENSTRPILSPEQKRRAEQQRRQADDVALI